MLVILLGFVFMQSLSIVSAQRNKAAKKPVNTGAKAFSISAVQSQLTLTLVQEGILRRIHPTHHVGVKSFSGRIQLPADESKASAELDAEAKSFANIDKNMSDIERSGFHKVLHEEVLASTKHPTIKFRSISISNIQKSGENRSFTLHGDLTLRGVTKRVAFPVKVTINGNQLRATGEEHIKQTDFGITPYSGGLGTIKIGDQLKVSFVIVAMGN
ncbi:MAG TPA: YceI family protein [Blastocatellia bacterium]|nr:YceI family protein [Blastocatellia bacterium]